MSRHFKQQRAKMSVHFNGTYHKSQPVADGEGVWKLDEATDGPFIAELDRLADARKLSVVRISSEVYEELIKKKPSPLPKPPGSQGPLIKVFRQSQTFHSESEKPSEKPSDAAPVKSLKGVAAVRLSDVDPEVAINLAKQQADAAKAAPAAPPEVVAPILSPKAKAKRGKKSEVNKEPTAVVNEAT